MTPTITNNDAMVLAHAFKNSGGLTNINFAAMAEGLGLKNAATANARFNQVRKKLMEQPQATSTASALISPSNKTAKRKAGSETTPIAKRVKKASNITGFTAVNARPTNDEEDDEEDFKVEVKSKGAVDLTRSEDDGVLPGREELDAKEERINIEKLRMQLEMAEEDDASFNASFKEEHQSVVKEEEN